MYKRKAEVLDVTGGFVANIEISIVELADTCTPKAHVISQWFTLQRGDEVSELIELK